MVFVGNTNSGAAFRTYTYDNNGAKSYGGTKTISYNLLNLPQTITQSGANIATYTYTAAGVKIRNTGTDANWDYVNGIVYQNNAIALYKRNKAGPYLLQAYTIMNIT